MPYAIRHITRYRYSAPVQENVMEARMQPRTEGPQRCLTFSLHTHPRTNVAAYHDYLGNIVHHFDIPGRHQEVTLTAEALVDIQPPPPLPEALPPSAWDALDRIDEHVAFWDLTRPSRYAPFSPPLCQFRTELNLGRQTDPLTTLRMLNRTLYTTFDYAPQSTRVDSPIDEALATRRGVCQDFTHIMIALVRSLGIPCRYVSGYLFHRTEDHDRSAEDATHAWVEAYLPELEWIGFDPTNNLVAGERHIRVAVGRDYADVPPTRGVFKGTAEDELSVGVRVTLADAPREPDEAILPPSLPDPSWEAAMLEAAQQ